MHILRESRSHWRQANDIQWWDQQHDDVISKSTSVEDSFSANSFFSDVGVFQEGIAASQNLQRILKGSQKGAESTAHLKETTETSGRCTAMLHLLKRAASEGAWLM